MGAEKWVQKTCRAPLRPHPPRPLEPFSALQVRGGGRGARGARGAARRFARRHAAPRRRAPRRRARRPRCGNTSKVNVWRVAPRPRPSALRSPPRLPAGGDGRPPHPPSYCSPYASPYCALSLPPPSYCSPYASPYCALSLSLSLSLSLPHADPSSGRPLLATALPSPLPAAATHPARRPRLTARRLQVWTN